MNVLYALLLGIAFAVIELMIGGTRLLFSLPAYGVLALAAVVSLADLRRPKVPPGGWCLAATALFCGYILARALTSPVAYIAWDDEFAVLGCLIVYLLTACYYTDPRRRLWLLGVLLLLAAGHLAVGARQFAGGDNFMLLWFIRPAQYTGRASGFYICPDHLAGYLEMLACLSLSMALWSRVRGWVKVLFGYAVLAFLAGILLTSSRGGFLSLCAGMTVLTLLSLGRVRAKSPEWFGRTVLAVVLVVALAAVGVGLTLSHSKLLQDRAGALFALQQDVRPQLWAAAVPEFQMSPVFGTGAATYLYYGRRFRNPGMQLDPIRPHSDYLELLAEYGGVGMAALLLFLAAHGWRGWVTYRRLSLRLDGLGGSGGGSNAAAWNIGALSAAACLVVHSAVDFNLHIPANALLLAFVFGVLANPGRPPDAPGDAVARWRRADLWPRLALPALGLWVLAAGVPKIPGEYFCEKARVALRDGHNAAVLDLARRGLEWQHENPALYYYLGQARQTLAARTADPQVARSFWLAASEAYGAGLRLAPMDIYLLVRQGEVLTRLGDLDAAEDIFRQVELWDPNSGYAATYYGFYLQSRGRLPEAEAAYRRAAASYPNETAVRNLNEIERARRGSQAE